ncbi:MAG TPA: hypothetical protein VHH36_05160 [Candidatus Thermoplasmatota archaeon]|nr:hypothetical protein [Candidatus Thermoplasmatota archaeon]
MNPEFLSGEASASPAVEPLLAGARRLARLGFGAGALSARNGSRTTTHANLPLELLAPGDFLEVADYDPHLDRILCIGKREPHAHAGMHALMLRAKREVNAIVMVDAREKPEALAALPQGKRGRTQLEQAMGALEALRGRDAAALGTHLVVTGRTPEEALARAEKLLGGA